MVLVQYSELFYVSSSLPAHRDQIPKTLLLFHLRMSFTSTGIHAPRPTASSCLFADVPVNMPASVPKEVDRRASDKDLPYVDVPQGWWHRDPGEYKRWER